jgi:hypothetical protein
MVGSRSMAELAVAGHHLPLHYRFESAHNLVLDLMVWNGAPLGLLLSIGIAWWVVTRTTQCKTTSQAAALAGLIALLAHSMVELPLQYAYFLMPAGLLVGLVEAHTSEERKLSAIKIPAIFAAPVLVTVSIVMAITFAEYRDWEESHQRLQFQQALKEPRQGYEPWVPEAVLLDGPRELMRLLLLPRGTRVDDRTLEKYRRVAERFATGEALLRYAELAAASGKPSEAERALSLACRFVFPADCDALKKSVMSSRSP